MPIYEYVCLKCGTVLELLQKVDENQVEEPCLICGGIKYQKKISSTISFDKKYSKQEDAKMKIAIATDGQSVSGHFGHCEGFTIYDCSEENISNSKKVQKKEFIPNPGHQPGFLPNFLDSQGVTTVIAGGMGGGAVQMFNEKKIEVITGASGDINVVLDEYLSGKLKSAGSICHEHQHSGSCGGHS